MPSDFPSAIIQMTEDKTEILSPEPASLTQLKVQPVSKLWLILPWVMPLRLQALTEGCWETAGTTQGLKSSVVFSALM